jgi:hypothetical protein
MSETLNGWFHFLIKWHCDYFFLGCHRINTYDLRVVILTGHLSPLEVRLLPFTPTIYVYINVIYVTCLLDEYIATVKKMIFELFAIRV